MKRIYMLAILAISAFMELQAQSLAVNTSGTTADNSSILDVSSTQKGILIPRMSKSERQAIASPAVGLVLYQNAPDSTGFYFYDGSQWNWLTGNKALDTTYWRATGNAGTNINRHFIGTTDSTPLSVKTFNSERIRFLPDGKIGIGVINPFTKFSNSPSNIGGADTIGVGNNSLTWVSNEIGYTQAVYNASPLIRANGLAVKIKGTTNKNVLLDLSTGSSQPGTGTSVLTAFGDGNIGIGTIAPKQKLDLRGKLAMNNNRILLRAGTDTSNYIVYDSTINGAKLKGIGGGILSSDSSNALYWKTNGNIGIGYANPVSLLSNTGTDIKASDDVGTAAQSISWSANQSGFTQTLYNTSGNALANGLAVKIRGTSNTNMLLDLSTGAVQDIIGSPVFTVLGNGNVGFGTNAPITKLSNTTFNIVGADGFGIAPNSITWLKNEQGFTAALYNASSISGAHGLAVKIKGATDQNTLLDLSTGNAPDVAGTPVLKVIGSGRIGIGTNSPITRLSNTSLSINGSDASGGGESSISWKINEAGFTHTMYNGSASNYAHGLAVKINGTSNSNLLLDLSTGTSQNATGSPVFSVLGSGKIGVGTINPFTKLGNTETDIAGSSGAGTGPGAISWKANEDGYTHAIYNGSANPNANGLAVKINGTSNSNMLFDLSTGGTQDIPGTPVFTVVGSGKIGVGTCYPFSKFSNTQINIAGSNGTGVGLGSFSWQMNEDGFTHAIYNASTSLSAHGLAVKIAGSDPHNVLLDLSNGVVSNAPGNCVFLVRGDGKTGIGTNAVTETLTVNGAVNITDGGYTALVNNATGPSPAGGAGTMVFSNNHFFGWNGTVWKQLDN